MDSDYKIRPVVIWAPFLFIGIILKIMHWPGSAPLILFCSAGLTAYSISCMFNPSGRNELNTTIMVMGMLWFVVLILGNLFNNGYPYNWIGMGVYIVVFLIYLLCYEIIRRRKTKTINE